MEKFRKLGALVCLGYACKVFMTSLTGQQYSDQHDSRDPDGNSRRQLAIVLVGVANLLRP